MTGSVRFAMAAAVAAGTSLSAAQADMINISGNGSASTEHLGSFSGTLTYTALDSNNATLVLTLTNNTAPAVGGYITAVALLHGDNFAGVTVVQTASSDSDFANLTSLVSAPPFGSYRGGSSTSGSWTGGGGPSAGTGVGQTLTLTYSLTGADVGLRSADDFIGLHGGHQDLVVRFRGMSDGGSDKVPGTSATLVPTPATASLLGLGVLAATRRERRR